MYVSAFGNEENINIGVEQDLGAGPFGTASSQTFEYLSSLMVITMSTLTYT